MQSPCVQQCTLNMDDTCVGCGRQLNEIMQWVSYSEKQRNDVNILSQGRLINMALENQRNSE